MARGWESKSVESQIEDAGSRSDRGETLTPEQRKIKRKREGLELSRRRVLQELETTRSAARRTSLEHALAFLDEELGKLTPPPQP
jgi:molecular chaperone GrpE (heat shock protein)